MGNVTIGDNKKFILIAGPCVLEDEKKAMAIALYLKKLTERLKMPFIFKASYDKANRTSIKSFRGPGLKKGLAILQRIREKLGVPVLSDVHRFEEIDPASKVLDVMQVPAGWSASLFLQGGSEDQATDLLEVLVPYDEGVTVMLKITAPEDEGPGQWQLLVNMVSFNRNRSVYQGEEQIITITIE